MPDIEKLIKGVESLSCHLQILLLDLRIQEQELLLQGKQILSEMGFEAYVN